MGCEEASGQAAANCKNITKACCPQAASIFKLAHYPKKATGPGP